jgi:hypothetical protein
MVSAGGLSFKFLLAVLSAAVFFAVVFVPYSCVVGQLYFYVLEASLPLNDWTKLAE